MAEFIEEIKTDEWEVETPSGWQSFSGIGKTVEYKVWIVKTTNHTLKCADDHILYSQNNTDDNVIKETFAKDLIVGNKLLCDNGLEEIVSVEETDEYKEMYDVLDVENGNVFYTNGILSHNSTTMVAYMLHYIMFNQNMNVAILANKQSVAKDILSRLQLTYEYLPLWLQQGIVEWNKASIKLENGSRIIASSTSSSAIRGGSYNAILLDEFAHVPTNIAEEFFNSVYPTISAGQNTKVIMISTPNGLNMFYYYWKGATKKPGEDGKNEYIPIEVQWDEVPQYPGGPLRDEKWKEDTIANTSAEQFQQEFICDFLGSQNTLISSAKLRVMNWATPKTKDADGLWIYEDPKEDHDYYITVDTSRGQGKDYSAFVVVDTTEMPYRLVARYRNNTVSPMVYPTIIRAVATKYNTAGVLIEINDIGGQVADILHQDLEYENVLMTTYKGRAGQVMNGGFGGNRSQSQLGVRTTVPVKKLGCSLLKSLIEEDKFIIEDMDVINELITFIAKKNSFEADDGHTDDLAMCLVLFAWMTRQEYFKSLTDSDVRTQIYEEQIREIEDDLMPFGFIVDESENGEWDGDDRWFSV